MFKQVTLETGRTEREKVHSLLPGRSHEKPLVEMRTFILVEMRTFILVEMRTFILVEMRTFIF